MPLPIIVPSHDNDYKDLRRGIARLIKSLNTGAIVHDNWALKTGLEETLPLITNTAGKIHCWMVSVKEAKTVGYTSGDGYYLDQILTVRVWGFIEEIGDDSSQIQIEKEGKLIAKSIILNDKHLAMENYDNVRDVGLFQVEDIDVVAFGDGVRVIRLKGTLEVQWVEPLQ